MNSIIKIHTVFALLIAFSLSFTLSSHAQEKAPYAQLLPEDVIYFQHTEKAEENRFPNVTQAFYNWVETLDDILEWRILKAEWEATQSGTDNQKLLDAICGDSYAYAISGFGEGGKIPTFVYLSYLDDTETADQALSGLFEYSANKHEMLYSEEDIFRGYDIQSLYGPGNIPGLGLSYTFHENLLLISTSKPYLIDLVDQFGFTEDTLANSAQFQAALSRLPSPYSSASYLNLNQLTDTLDVLLEMGKAFQAMEKDENLKGMLGMGEEVVKYVKMFHYYASVKYKKEEDVYANKGIFHFDPAIADTPIGTLLKNEPVSFNFASYMPRKTGTFQAGNILSPPDLWEIWNTVIRALPADGKIGEMTKSINQFETKTGISIQGDLLSWMGGEWCWVKPVMNLDAVVPTNKFALMLSVKNQARAEAGLRKMQSALLDTYKLPIVPETTTYRNTEITKFVLPIPFIPFTPSMALNNEVFILASHDSMIREMLDVKAGTERGLTRNRYYNQLSGYLEEPANHISFQDIESEFYTYREALTRVSTLSDLGKEFLPTAEKVPFILMNRASYLVTCLQFMKAAVKHNTLTDDSWISESITIMRDLRSVPNMQNIKRETFSIAGKEHILQLAKVLVKAGQHDTALRIYKVVGEFYPDDKRHLLDAAEALKQSGQEEQAMELYSQAVKTASQPSIFIELADAQEFESPEEVHVWLNQLTQNKPGLNQEAILMGIALQLLKKDQEDIAASLFESVIQSQINPALKQAAENELGKLSQDITPSVRVPIIENYPTIDGEKDGTWDAGAVPSLVITSANENLKLNLARSGAQLYVLAEAQAQHAKVREETLELYLCTSRGYTPVYIIQISATNTEETSSTTKQAYTRVIDHWDVFPERGTENLNTNWPAGTGQQDGTRFIEFSLPLLMVSGDNPSSLWSINAKYTIEYENGERFSEWLVDSAETNTPDDPFGYLNISLE